MPKQSIAPQSPETLAKIADQISETAAMFRAVADQMPTIGIERMEVASYKSLVLGMGNLDAFASAVRDAFRNAKENRGDFRAGEVIETYKAQRKRVSPKVKKGSKTKGLGLRDVSPGDKEGVA
jgi:hypothetical protein